MFEACTKIVRVHTEFQHVFTGQRRKSEEEQVSNSSMLIDGRAGLRLVTTLQINGAFLDACCSCSRLLFGLAK